MLYRFCCGCVGTWSETCFTLRIGYSYQLWWIIPAFPSDTILDRFHADLGSRMATKVSPVDPCLLLLSNQRMIWSHLLYVQAVLNGGGGTGTRTNSCTVQRRHVSPAAIAGVRWR